MINGVGTVFKKELTRVFKDKKLVFSLFILPVIIIVGMFSLINTLIGKVDKDIEEHRSVVYLQNAPQDFQVYLERTGETSLLEYLEQEDDVALIKEGIREGTVDLLIVFEEGFRESIDAYKTGAAVPQVKTFYNPSEDYSQVARRHFVEEVLESYRQELLRDRIGDLSQIQVFTIDTDNTEMVIQDEDKAAGKMLGMFLPYFITMMLFAGVMSLGIDSITGEKERGTLAMLLLTPLQRSSIVLGKILALMLLSGLSAATYVVAMVISLPKIMGGGGIFEGFNINFTVGQVLEMVAIMVSLVFLYVAVVSLVAVLVRTAKEGGAYVAPLYIIVIAAGLITMYGASEPQLTSYLIPLYNSALAMKELFTRELSLLEFIITVVSTLAAGGILTGIIVKAFNSEKVMFNA